MADTESTKKLRGVVVSALETATTAKTLQRTRTADAFLAAAGAAGSLALLHVIQDCLSSHLNIHTPVTGGFLVGSATKLFLNRNPPTLDAFWKSTAFSIVMGTTLHSFLWTSGEDEATTVLSNEFNVYLIFFFMLLYWKLHPGTIWSAGSALAQFLSFKSGFWFQKAAENGALRTLATDFPAWFILGPYLVGHAYLYVCALGLAKIRRQVRIYLVRNDIFTPEKHEGESDSKPCRIKLRKFFDRIDTSGDGRLDAMEFKLALRASVGDDVPLEDCQKMIGTVDADGDETLDFNEFCELIDNHVLKL